LFNTFCGQASVFTVPEVGNFTPAPVPLTTSTVLSTPAIPSVSNQSGLLTHQLDTRQFTDRTKNPVTDQIKSMLKSENQEGSIYFTISQSGGTHMMLNNFVYKKNKGLIQRKQGMTINLICMEVQCNTRLVTVDGKIPINLTSQNHETNENNFEEKKEAGNISKMQWQVLQRPLWHL
jgi:hypothetical protein